MEDKTQTTNKYPSWVENCPAMHPDLTRLEKAGWLIFFAPDGEITGSLPTAFDCKNLPLQDCLTIQNILEKWVKK